MQILILTSLLNFSHIASNHEILVINVPMKGYDVFIADLQALLTLIKNETNKVFVPIAISHSPIKPESDFIIVFRTSDNVQAIPLDGWFTKNIP